ncbi:hypothetical protein PLESTB_000018900 [Pleodorina starrii]|uniref:phytol kinase n=1 Tax=Pleodorina starrii TaxID=330485 RepID=A0A9W6B9M6_9CHLO|nr:hypothetical protein PLESTM_001115900 [Pleodorina starrii]GLC47723.1 hypothetical protein PLESTB_000018900 [Pleodorina starrii]GLC70865.1 hypothetical protein PLESTF_001041300 [Pleodorina starrii]
MRRNGSGAAGGRSGARVSSSSSGASRTTAAIAADEDLPAEVQTALLQLPAGLENLARKWGFPVLAQPAAATCAAAAAGASRGSGRGGGRHRATRSTETSVSDLDQQVHDVLNWVKSRSPVGRKCILQIAANGVMLQSLVHATAAAARVPVDRLFNADDEQFVELRCLHVACTLGMEVLRRLPCAAAAATEAGVTAAPFQGLPLMHGFARKLLRMQTLHALSRQTAHALKHVLEATAAASAAGFPTRWRRSLARTVKRLEFLLSGCAVVIEGFAKYAFALGMARNGGDWSFAREMVAALHDSGLMEHTVRALLHRQLLPPEAVMAPHGGGEAGARAAHARGTASHCFLQLFYSIDALASGGGAANSVTRLLQQVLSGRCIRTAAQLHGLAALCAADGGSSYGFEPELLRQIPVLAADGSPVDLPAVAAARPSNADPWVICPQLDATAPVALIASLPNGSDASAPPPPGRRASVRLLLRIIRWAVASMQAADPATIRGGGGGGSGGSGAGGEPRCQPQVRAVLAPVDAASVANLALARAHPLLEPRAGFPTWVLEVDECWQLTFATVRHGMRLAESKQLTAMVARLMMAGLDDWAPPPEHVMALSPPPPNPAAALSAGWLPCLELLLRRAAREPPCPEAAAVLQATNPGSSRLVQALAYGSRHQAAALVTTLGKLLWRRLAAAENPAPADAATAPADPTYQWALQAVRCILYWMDWMEVAPPEGQQAAAQRQLSDLLSYAAGEWLPPLSRLAKLSLMSAGTWPASAVGPPDGWYTALLPLLRVLPALAARCLTADEAAAGSSGAGLQLAAAAAADPGPESAAARHGAETPTPEPADSSGTAAAAAVVVVAVGSSTAENGTTTAEAAATTTAAAADSVSGWRRLLFIDMDAAQLLGMVLFVSRALREREGGAGLWGEAEDVLTARAHHAVQAACREELRAGTVDQAGAGAGAAALRTLSGEEEAAVTAAGVLPLPSPEEARRRLPRRCANAACTNLDGDSEAELRLRACSGCGEAGYCGRGCQVTDWWAGHKEVCSGGRRGP